MEGHVVLEGLELDEGFEGDRKGVVVGWGRRGDGAFERIGRGCRWEGCWRGGRG